MLCVYLGRGGIAVYVRLLVAGCVMRSRVVRGVGLLRLLRREFEGVEGAPVLRGCGAYTSN